MSSLGDILLTYPLISILRKQNSYSDIHFVVKEQFVEAIKYNPFVNKILTYSKNSLKELKSTIKKNEYDIIIDLQNNFRSHQLYSFNLKSKIYRFRKPTLKKFLLVNFKLNLLRNNPSIAVHYIKTVFPNFDSKDLDLYFNIPENYQGKSLENNSVENPKQKIIGICPGSKHFTKRYPTENFKILIQKLTERNFVVAIFGGKDDYEACKELEIYPSVKNFQNDNDLIETAALMKKCSVIITNDSGLMHLASLLQIPTVAIFGSTVREFGFFPIFEKSIIIENENLKCRPCSHIGKNECPKKHFKCMNEIEPNLIFSKTIELIQENS